MVDAWMIRAGRGGSSIDDFLKHKVVAIGWVELPDLSRVNNRDELEKLIEKIYEGDRPGQRQSSLTQVSTFKFVVKLDDDVVSYNPISREYHLGKIRGDYEYNETLIDGYRHFRKVEWLKTVNRDDLSLGTRNTLGASQTIFSLNNVIQELRTQSNGRTAPAPDSENEQIEMEQLRKDVIGQSHEFIKDLLLKLSWEEMQDLVAGLLRAMGYQTRVSPPGADRGKDIVASRDGLGLEPPRVRVEVKHRPKEVIGAPMVRSFLGALRSGDRGVYVATGGYTREAEYEAERAQYPITLIDLDDLVAFLTQHYEKLDMDSRALVPLVRVYWPAN